MVLLLPVLYGQEEEWKIYVVKVGSLSQITSTWRPKYASDMIQQFEGVKTFDAPVNPCHPPHNLTWILPCAKAIFLIPTQQNRAKLSQHLPIKLITGTISALISYSPLQKSATSFNLEDKLFLLWSIYASNSLLVLPLNSNIINFCGSNKTFFNLIFRIQSPTNTYHYGSLCL